MLVADVLTTKFGSISFLFANLVVFTAWITINSGVLPWVPIFDPFPFILLTMVVSLEAIVLSIIVLMSQSRQGHVSSLRDELQLQVNLIAEREVTKILQLLTELHHHHGIQRESDPELQLMLKSINTSYIEKKLEEQLRVEQTPSVVQVLTKPIEKISQKVPLPPRPRRDKNV